MCTICSLLFATFGFLSNHFKTLHNVIFQRERNADLGPKQRGYRETHAERLQIFRFRQRHKFHTLEEIAQHHGCK